MGRFTYQAKDNEGRLDNGVLAASSAEEASMILRRDGKTIMSLHEEQYDMEEYNRSRARKMKIKRDDVIFFATQLAVMVDTGVPISEALDSIAAQTEHPGLKVTIEDIAEQIKGGTEFSTALEGYPKLFDNLFVALIRASEASGTMGLMLERLSEYMAAERATRNKIKGAMTYPLCMLSFCVLVVVALLVFVLPKFEKIYSNKGAALPVPTQILLTASHTLRDYWAVIIVLLVGAVVGGVYYFRKTSGRLVLDKIKISAPILGPMYRKACLSRSLRTMSTMISSGVSMLDSLEITSQAAGNEHYSRIWRDLSEKVAEGSSLSDELFVNPLVPKTVTQMISAGERTGRLGQVMDRVAKFCEDDLSVAVKTLTNLIEPAMIIVMGLLIGGIAIALLLPVFSIAKVVAN